MSEEEIKRTRENYILAYRSNYDSARELHNKVFDYIEQLQQENQQLKEVLDEIREYIKENYNLNWYVESCYKDDLLQILDKVKE